MDAWGLHGLSCHRSAPRHQCHSQLNDVIWRAIKRAQMPSVRASQPDVGRQQTAWWDYSSALGQRKTYGLGCDQTRMPSLISSTIYQARCSSPEGSTEVNKSDKYARLSSTHICPFAIETAGTWPDTAIELNLEIYFVYLVQRKCHCKMLTSWLTKDKLSSLYANNILSWNCSWLQLFIVT